MLQGVIFSMTSSDFIFYIPPVIFSIVALAFLLIWRMNVTPTWQWGAGFAQTAAGFVVSTFLNDPHLAAFASGMIFIGASYCYGSGLLAHFDAPQFRKERLGFVGLYTAALAYTVYVENSLVRQLFLTDIGFALLLGGAVWIVSRRASRPIDLALVITCWIVVFNSVVRAVFFTFFTNSSDNLGDFATSLYNVAVSISTITVCMLCPFTVLAATTSSAIEKHRSAAETDEMTGLLNRRGFKRALGKGLGASAAGGALIACDIDHFKRVNDTYGHAVGDMVIKKLGSDLKNIVGASGQAARYGGEEFVIHLPSASLQDARALAEHLRTSFASGDWAALGIAEGVTISIGISRVRDREATIEDAMDRADRALYAAKAAGRNQVMIEEDFQQTSAPAGQPATFRLVANG